MRCPEDLDLARASAAGSTAAWQEFVIRYSALVLATVRRYMPGFELDDHRSVYVDILAQFHSTALRRYNGSVTLASWVIVVSRSRCMDALRAHHGRKRLPAWLQRHSSFDQDVYRLFYLEGANVPAVVTALRRTGSRCDAPDVEAALDRLEAQMGPRLRTQVAYELQARSVAGATSRLLEFLDDLRRRNAETQERLRPDLVLIEKESQEMASRVRDQVAGLPGDERHAIELYYGEGLQADAVAARMGLRDGRRVRGLVRSALKRLRRSLNAANPSTPNRPRVAEEFPRCSFNGGER